MLKRTPILALIFAAIMSALIIFIFQEETRPFTMAQMGMLYFFSFLPSLGFAMLLDPYPQKVKERYLKINFYIQEEDPAEQVAKIIAQEEAEKNDSKN